MASKPNTKHAVLITPANWDSPILFTFSDVTAASSIVATFNNDSDASAENVGTVYETPMVVTRPSAECSWNQVTAETLMRTNFERVLPDRRLLAIRGIENKSDPSGDFATGTALWAFAPPPLPEVAPTTSLSEA